MPLTEPPSRLTGGMYGRVGAVIVEDMIYVGVSGFFFLCFSFVLLGFVNGVFSWSVGMLWFWGSPRVSAFRVLGLDVCAHRVFSRASGFDLAVVSLAVPVLKRNAILQTTAKWWELKSSCLRSIVYMGRHMRLDLVEGGEKRRFLSGLDAYIYRFDFFIFCILGL